MNTEELLLRLTELNKSSQLLETPEPERLEMIDTVTDYANHFIAGLSTVKAFQDKEATSLEITNQKRSLSDLLDLYQKQVAETGINAASGKHHG